jgi:hypothetical protein
LLKKAGIVEICLVKGRKYISITINVEMEKFSSRKNEEKFLKNC